MKPRLKMDGLLLALVVVFSLGIYFFPKVFYAQSHFDDFLDFGGFLLILIGSFIRMSARGHKIDRSPGGWGLAEDGLYTYTRNPMYLGTFTIGVGFTLIIWPWWASIVFMILFYFRFSPLIMKEEKYLTETYGQNYQEYCRKVPKFFPSPIKIFKIRLGSECPWHELWQTKEWNMVWSLPLIIFIAEIFKEWILYRMKPTVGTFLPFILAFIVFAVILGFEYFLKNEKNSK